MVSKDFNLTICGHECNMGNCEDKEFAMHIKVFICPTTKLNLEKHFDLVRILSLQDCKEWLEYES